MRNYSTAEQKARTARGEAREGWARSLFWFLIAQVHRLDVALIGDRRHQVTGGVFAVEPDVHLDDGAIVPAFLPRGQDRDRKSTRLNSSHVAISYAVFCLKKKKLKKRI